ncbi:uncharacterized protein [Vulpes vulpes]|uniref:Uncharacterized protein n=1 Tax=Vulpes vulpes TaxID=9627 RepID=A0ABM4XTS7_VULVU
MSAAFGEKEEGPPARAHVWTVAPPPRVTSRRRQHRLAGVVRAYVHACSLGKLGGVGRQWTSFWRGLANTIPLALKNDSTSLKKQHLKIPPQPTPKRFSDFFEAPLEWVSTCAGLSTCNQLVPGPGGGRQQQPTSPWGPRRCRRVQDCPPVTSWSRVLAGGRQQQPTSPWGPRRCRRVQDCPPVTSWSRVLAGDAGDGSSSPLPLGVPAGVDVCRTVHL